MFGFQLTGQILMIVGLSQFFAEPMAYSPDVSFNLFNENEQAFILDSFENNALFPFLKCDVRGHFTRLFDIEALA